VRAELDVHYDEEVIGFAMRDENCGERVKQNYTQDLKTVITDIAEEYLRLSRYSVANARNQLCSAADALPSYVRPNSVLRNCTIYIYINTISRTPHARYKCILYSFLLFFSLLFFFSLLIALFREPFSC
jgi:hypothetical protein